MVKQVPALDKAMRAAEATNLSLSDASGVCDKTVSNARGGKSIQVALADVLMQTLCVRRFSYKKIGRPRKSDWHSNYRG